MKHFHQIKAPANRKEKYLLITEDGQEFDPFNAVMRNLARQGYAENTIEQYAGHIARFIDYVYEASEHLPDNSSDSLLETIYSYRSFLLHGTNSEDPLARKIAEEIRPLNVTNNSSLLPIGAAIKYFLTLSDAKAISEEQASLFEKISMPKKRLLNDREKNALKKKSMLASVIRSGPKLIDDSEGVFGRRVTRSGSKSRFQREAIPFDKVGELIGTAKSYRDKAFYSLLAASGCRQHEAIQIHLNDINFKDRTVVLLNPFERKEKTGLSESEEKRLAWKGRATEITFLIEPFKSMFFTFIEEYIRHERIAHGEHPYIFQKKNGRPWLTTSRQSRAENFRKLKDKIGLKGKAEISGHSLRHMYGVYTLNYLPLPDRFGLPMTTVKLLMGHDSLSNTEKYARQDKDLALQAIEHANQQMYSFDKLLTLEEIKIKYHQRQIDKVILTTNRKKELTTND